LTNRNNVPIGNSSTTKEGVNQMLFDLSPYLPLPAFIILWAIGMLALIAFFDRNDTEGK
jgi:hypothetical protein